MKHNQHKVICMSDVTAGNQMIVAKFRNTKGSRHPTESGATLLWIFVKQSIDNSFTAPTQDSSSRKHCYGLINENISLCKSASGPRRQIDPGAPGKTTSLGLLSVIKILGGGL